jgi:hypothetical protein
VRLQPRPVQGRAPRIGSAVLAAGKLLRPCCRRRGRLEIRRHLYRARDSQQALRCPDARTSQRFSQPVTQRRTHCRLLASLRADPSKKAHCSLVPQRLFSTQLSARSLTRMSPCQCGPGARSTPRGPSPAAERPAAARQATSALRLADAHRASKLKTHHHIDEALRAGGREENRDATAAARG